MFLWHCLALTQRLVMRTVPKLEFVRRRTDFQFGKSITGVKGWENYSALGSVIKGTRIVCFKVPLKNPLVEKLPEEERFTPSKLIKMIADSNHNLGLVIDLTFTRKYYNSKELTDRGIEYEKIFTKGHEVPSDFVFGRFAHVIDTFLEQSSDSTSVIGVHCTHGVNRTGYLVCRYMVESLSIKPDDAIAAFNEARGHDVERENYIQDLHTRIPGEKTPFDPSATPPEESVPDTSNRRIDKLGQPGYKADNSYSKLLEKHRSPYDNRNSNNSRQGERDHEMRPHRGQPGNNDRRSQPWQQRYDDGGGAYPGNGYSGYQGNDNGWHQGYGGYHGNNYGGYDGNRYSQSSHYDSHNRRHRSRDHYQYNDYAKDGDYSYDVDFSQKEGYGQNRTNGEKSAYIKQHRNNEDYRSPMKYADWTADDRDQYDKSGWSSGPRSGRRNQGGYNRRGYNQGGYNRGGNNRGGYNGGGWR